MNPRQLFAPHGELPCARLFDDDGPESFDDDGDAASRRSDLRKLNQLCAQVRRALELTLNTGMESLSEHIELIAVEADPDATRLRVTVGVDVRCSISVPVLQARLAAMRPRLRADIALAIHRKRVPQLQFDCVPRKEGLL